MKHAHNSHEEQHPKCHTADPADLSRCPSSPYMSIASLLCSHDYTRSARHRRYQAKPSASGGDCVGRAGMQDSAQRLAAAISGEALSPHCWEICWMDEVQHVRAPSHAEWRPGMRTISQVAYYSVDEMIMSNEDRANDVSLNPSIKPKPTIRWNLASKTCQVEGKCLHSGGRPLGGLPRFMP